jgi:hypothetical protein
VLVHVARLTMFHNLFWRLFQVAFGKEKQVPADLDLDVDVEDYRAQISRRRALLLKWFVLSSLARSTVIVSQHAVLGLFSSVAGFWTRARDCSVFVP